MNLIEINDLIKIKNDKDIEQLIDNNNKIKEQLNIQEEDDIEEDELFDELIRKVDDIKQFENIKFSKKNINKLKFYLLYNMRKNSEIED